MPYIPLYDPDTHLPTGKFWHVSQIAYDKIMSLARNQKKKPPEGGFIEPEPPQGSPITAGS